MPTPISPIEDPTGRESEDPTGVVYSVEFVDGKVGEAVAEQLGRDAISDARTLRKRITEKTPEPELVKIHPLLQEWRHSRDLAERHELLIVARENLEIPRFPEPDGSQPRSSRTNQRLLKRADALVGELTKRRAEGQSNLVPIAESLDGKVLEQFWLVNAMLVDIPLHAVEKLASVDEIISIEPRYSEEPPPQNEPDVARGLIVSDPYFGFKGTFVGILDTGVRATHTMFRNPDHLDFLLDTVNGGANGNGPGANPDDTDWNHGTSTAAIITGNGNLGADHRGVTDSTLDSIKIYTAAGLDEAATLRGFQRAVAILDRVIVGEIQANQGSNGSISQAADAAFDAGAAVIAANGNFGPNASTVRSPGNAHRAIGVGNIHVQTLATSPDQGRGPASDGRIKPDVQAPSNTETASNASDTALHVFTGTSGATPYASGAAVLLRNFLRTSFGLTDPGQVYAQMILSGRETSFDNTRGTGLLKLPTDGFAFVGNVNVGNKQNIDISIPVGEGIRTIEAALWWPEHTFRFVQQFPFFAFEPHSDIDLRIMSPAGATRAMSISIPSVFERARVTGTKPLDRGTWKLRITGFRVPHPPQKVFWSAVTVR
ncbi:MAG: S8 family serine peptidase [Microbacterium sp.]